MFIDLLGFGFILPLLPVYIKHYGGTPAIGGLLLGTFSLMQFIFAPIWGRASDRYGRRPLILLSLLGSAFSYFCFGAAGSIAVLFVARVASGILTAASMPTAQAYIADVTPPEKRAGGMALLGMAFGLGFAFGPMIGGILSQYSLFGGPPLATPAYFAAALALVNFVLAFFLLPETHTDRQETMERRSALDAFPAIARALRNPTIGAQMTVFAFATFAFTAVEASFSWLVILRFQPVLIQMAAHQWQTYTHLPFAKLPLELRSALPGASSWAAFAHLPFSALPQTLQTLLREKAATKVTSQIFTVVGLTILVVQGVVMAGLSRLIRENRLVAIGALLLTGTLIGLALAPNLTTIYLLSACIAIGSGIMNPALSALITHAAGPQERGTLSGAQQGLGSLARIVAPPINNKLIEIPHGTGIPFFVSSLLMGIAFFLSLRLQPLPHVSTPAATETDDAASHGGEAAHNGAATPSPQSASLSPLELPHD